MEATLEVERELREQGWQLDESLEEFRWCQQRGEKQKEVDTEDWGHALAAGQGRLIVFGSKFFFFFFFFFF